MAHARSVGERFETEPNAFHFLRLVLALQVVAWHAYGLNGDTWLPEWAERITGDIAVDSFFAVSGFLICRSWSSRPEVGPYLSARARRILPGLWVCLFVTAFVIAPVAAYLSGTPSPTTAGQWAYVVGNADTWSNVWDIDGGPSGVPVPGLWNGSLWTLGYEVSAYLVLMALGVSKLLRPRIVLALAICCWVLGASFVVGGAYPFHPAVLVTRVGLMFACGVLMWMHRDRLPMSRVVFVAAGALLAVGALTPSYRLVAAPALTYLCVVLAVRLGRYPRLVFRRDLSYGVYVYGFPVQQALVLCGVSIGWVGFSVLSAVLVLPLAAASWFVVERPAMQSRWLPRVQRQEV